MTTNIEIFSLYYHSDIIDLCNDIDNYINTFYNFLIKHINIDTTVLEKNNEYDSDFSSDND